MPSVRTVSNIKANLLRPATTSHFEVQIPIIDALKDFKERSDQESIQLMCSEASLPGSNLATFDINNDRTGVTEKHVHRKIFDDRLDLTFYVDAGVYRPIQFFEAWIDYITTSAEDNILSLSPDNTLDKQDINYFYRMRYPKGDTGYMSEQALKVIKFEKDHAFGGDGRDRVAEGSTISGGGGSLEYTFVNSFPLAINSMPVSYDTSSLLKCTVSMSYIRYFVNHKPTPRDGDLMNELKQKQKDNIPHSTKTPSIGDMPAPPNPVLIPPQVPEPIPPQIATLGRAWGQRSDGTFGLI